MLTKLIGGAFIIVSSTCWGFSKADTLSKREKTLRNLKTAFNLLEGEIIFSSHYLKNALQRISRLCDCGELFMCASERIEDMGAAKAWQSAVGENKKMLALKESDVEILNTFSAGLGVSDREQQVKNIRHVSSLLETALEDARNEIERSFKIYRSVGFFGGLFLVILLL